jgi:hypothetical protein
LDGNIGRVAMTINDNQSSNRRLNGWLAGTFVPRHHCSCWDVQ